MTIVDVLLALAIILTAGHAAGRLAEMMKQPAVLGELCAGVVLGAIGMLAAPRLSAWPADPAIDTASQVAVGLLMFDVGLESTIRDMLAVGLPSLLVAMFGIAGPFVLGWLAGLWLLPGAGTYAHVFLAATLTATSVGVTARVLRDLGCSHIAEARIILGAAVLDDVFGLVILAVVTGVITAANTGTAVSAIALTVVLAKAGAIVAGPLAIGIYASENIVSGLGRIRWPSVRILLALTFCFVMALVAHALGLATIVGAFAAGLILDEFADAPAIRRIASFAAPVFFVVMGMRTDVRAFEAPGVLTLAAALVASAIIGKQLSGLGAVGRNVDKVTIGIGMMPRGEVDLIFANVGMTLAVAGKPVMTPTTFAAIVITVLATAVATPAALKWRLSRVRRMPLPPPGSEQLFPRV